MSVAGGEVAVASTSAGVGIGGDASRTTVAGRYRVEGAVPLGTGGMAIVYRGRDLRTRRDVALKTVRPELRDDPETCARFRREIRRMQSVAHRNIVKVFDIQEEADATWAVLEYVPGQTLKELVAKRGPLSPVDTAGVLTQAADALACLHAHGLVHLDVKPQNLVRRSDGTVKLLDFGLAQPAGQTQERIGGNTFGTVAYLAPEQAQGDTVDVASDVYALGCVIYELLTGRPPFRGDEPGGAVAKTAVIRAHLERDPEPPSHARPDLKLPGWIDDVVLRALAKRPADRYPTVTAFAQAFRAGVTGVGAASQRATDRIPAVAEPPSPTAMDAIRRVTGQQPGRRLAAALYRTGGRAARRSRRAQPLLWRLTAAFLIGNLMLYLLLQAQGGAAARWLEGKPTLHAGGAATVAVDGLHLRAGAGLDQSELAALPAGAAVSVTGPAESVDDLVWWPVTVGDAGAPMAGYVWADGLAPKGSTGPAAWWHALVNRGGQAVDAVSGLANAIRHAVG